MEHQKIPNLLNGANDSKFVTRKWNIVKDNSNSNCGAANEIAYNRTDSKILWQFFIFIFHDFLQKNEFVRFISCYWSENLESDRMAVYITPVV